MYYIVNTNVINGFKIEAIDNVSDLIENYQPRTTTPRGYSAKYFIEGSSVYQWTAGRKILLQDFDYLFEALKFIQEIIIYEIENSEQLKIFNSENQARIYLKTLLNEDNDHD